MNFERTIFYFLGILFFLITNSCQKIKKDLNINKSIPPNFLAIQPFGNVSKEEVLAVKKSILQYYELQIKVLPNISLPKNCNNTAVGEFLKTKLALRYRADSLLIFLKKNKPKGIQYILGITNEDITCTNRDKNGQITYPSWMHSDWGIFGLGYCPGSACIISSFRLKFDNPIPKKLHERLSRVARHEIGHNFGLPHCTQKKLNCFMAQVNLQNALLSLDTESDSLCSLCKKQVKYAR